MDFVCEGGTVFVVNRVNIVDHISLYRAEIF